MEFLGPEDEQFLREAFGRLAADVHLKLETKAQSRIVLAGGPPSEAGAGGTDGEDLSAEISGLLTEIASTSEHIKLTATEVSAHSGEPLPAITFSSTRSKGRLRYLGLPAGHETSTLIATILDLGTDDPLIPDEVVERLAKLEREVHIEVFVTPTCPHCPRMARVAFQLAMVCDKVKADVVEVQEFPALGEKYSVRGVPTTVVNGAEALLGVVNPMDLVALVEKQGAEPSRIIML